MRYFEDIPADKRSELGSRTVTEAEILEFARRYDPLTFHLDEQAAAETMHGGIIASGYHTLCIANKIVVENFRREVAAVAGLGLDDLRWNAPVRPGDRLRVGHEVVEKRRSTSRPEYSILRNRITVRRDDESVLEYVEIGLVERRDAD